MQHTHFFEAEQPEEVFWCHECDSQQISSKKPETGQFFRATGHTWNFTKKRTGKWRTVIFAVCKDCLRKHNWRV